MNSARIAWTAYKEAGLATRLHVVARALTCPFHPLISRFPVSGAMLDVGCGHGLLLKLLNGDLSRRNLRIHGIDHDSAKIDAARRTLFSGVEFSTKRLDHFPEGAFDAVSILDVLYTIRKERWGEILGECFRVLRPGGRLILKEVVDQPRWKYWAVLAQESLALKVFGITKGGDYPHFESVETYREAILDSGFAAVEACPLSSPHWISHYLFIGLKL